MTRTDLAAMAAACLFMLTPSVLAQTAPDWQRGVLSEAADLLEAEYIYEDRGGRNRRLPAR